MPSYLNEQFLNAAQQFDPTKKREFTTQTDLIENKNFHRVRKNNQQHGQYSQNRRKMYSQRKNAPSNLNNHEKDNRKENINCGKDSSPQESKKEKYGNRIRFRGRKRDNYRRKNPGRYRQKGLKNNTEKRRKWIKEESNRFRYIYN